ncbi:MAG: N-acetylmuramoyl-L-alanine amidase [Bacteroidales bacterium]|nr:N-acetylmuramoyl-L-alanine amidase [Bacteroidales bacterium]
MRKSVKLLVPVLVAIFFLTIDTKAQVLNSSKLMIDLQDAEQAKMLYDQDEFTISDPGMVFSGKCESAALTTRRISVPLTERGDFLAFGIAVDHSETPRGVRVEYRLADTAGAWGAWSEAAQTDLIAREPSRFRSELYFADRDVSFIQVRLGLSKQIDEYITLRNISLFFTSPLEESDKTHTSRLTRTDAKAENGFTRPPYVSRTDWGCPQAENTTDRELTTVTHLIIHHSAGHTSSGNFAAVVLAYWDYHVNGNGWADIGYNWLVDRNGVIYKGRAWYDDSSENVKGAHNSGLNGGTAGICMIGNYTEDTIPSSALWNASWDILAYLCDHYGLDPQGISYHAAIGRDNDVITGHRDSGGGTACPGDIANSYDAIRQAVAAKLAGTYIAGPVNREAFSSECPGGEVEFTWENSGTGWQVQVAEEPDFEPYYVKWVSGLTSYTGPNGFVLAPDETDPLDEFAEGARYFWRMAYEGHISTTSSFTMPSCSSDAMNSLQEELSVFVYPNPCDGNVTISWKELTGTGFQVKLFDPSGRQVFAVSSPSAELDLRLENLPSGIYILRVDAGRMVEIVRLVVTNRN